MKLHISSSCTWVTGRSRSKCTLISWAFCAARRSHSRTVSSVTPDTKLISERATLTSSIFKAIMTFSSGVLRSKKTVSRVSEKGRVHWLQQKMRRLPLWVIYVEMALMLPRFISQYWEQSGLGHGWPQSLGFHIGQSSDRVVVCSTLIGGLAFFLFQSTTG